MKRLNHIALLVVLALAFWLPSSAYGQGTAQIRKVKTIPATCDASGSNSDVVLWKIAAPNPGIYTCISGSFTYQTNTFGSGLTAKTMIYASAAPVGIVSTVAPTNGQLLIGSTGAVPALGTLTGTANETLITNGAASITIGMAASVQHKGGANWLFTDTTDTTKKFQWDLSGITTGTTRTISAPDSNTTLPIVSQIVTIAGPTAARTYTFPDAAAVIMGTGTTQNVFSKTLTMGGASTNLFADNADPSKTAKLDLSGITTATQRTVTIPDQDSFTVRPLTAVDGLVVNAASSGTLTTGTVEMRLATVPGVDMNTGTATTLYVCPSGRSCVITRIIVRNASTSLTTASYSFGWTSAAFNDVVANATHTELTGATLYTTLNPIVGAKLGTSTGVFKVIMNTLQGGAATTTMELFGYTF